MRVATDTPKPRSQQSSKSGNVRADTALNAAQTIAVAHQDTPLGHAKNASVFLGDEAALANRAVLKEVLTSWRRTHPKKRMTAGSTPQPDTKAELEAKRTSLAAALLPVLKRMSLHPSKLEIDAAARHVVALEGAPLDEVADALSALLGLGLPLKSSVYNKQRLMKTSTPLLDWLTPTLAEELALVLEAHDASPRTARLLAEGVAARWPARRHSLRSSVATASGRRAIAGAQPTEKAQQKPKKKSRRP